MVLLGMEKVMELWHCCWSILGENTHHCIIYQHVLCNRFLGYDHEISIIVSVVNYI